MADFDFEGVARAALAAYPGLLERWFPAGKRHGREFRIGDLSGAPGESLSINVETGAWADFAAGISGGDAVSLYAAITGKKQIEAAKELSERLGVGLPDYRPPAAAKPKPAKWTQIVPVPAGASPPPQEHPAHGKPHAVWAYLTADGEVMGYIYRFNMADGGKEVIPVCFCEQPGRKAWKWQSFSKPRPIYGLDRLAAMPTASVIIVEGEKCADAARDLFPGVAVISWPGGGKAAHLVDWSPVTGRKVVIWPDHDRPGYDTAEAIAELLKPIAAGIKIAMPPQDRPQGWDAADAVADGWGSAAAMDWLRSSLTDPGKAAEAVDDLPMEYDPGPSESYIPPDDDQPFTVLGYNRGTYFYLPYGSKQVHELSATGHTKGNLMALAPLQYWEREYPSKQGCNWDAAANALLRKCERAGVYDHDRIRGRGAWWDDGRAVVHAGDRLIVDGREIGIPEHRSRFIYEACPAMGLSIDDPLPASEAVRFLRLCEMLPWEKPIYARIMAGWCVVAQIGGAMQWRPHIWVTGPSGSGKSWIYEHILIRSLRDWAVPALSTSTEAGLRGKLGADCLPVVFEEAEGNDERAQQRIQNIVELIRSASSESGAAIFKGSASGGFNSYQIRSPFALCSIGVNLDHMADLTRFAILSLHIDEDKSEHDRLEHFRLVTKTWAETMTDDFVARLHARSIHLIPTIRANAHVFAEAGAEVLGTRRMGDQIGALLAGAYALHSSKAISFDEARSWLAGQDWSDETAIQEQRDELTLLAGILEHEIIIEATRPTRRTLGELIARAQNPHVESLIEANVADETLRRHGIKVVPAYDDDQAEVWISNTHPAIGRMLAKVRGGKYVKNWGRYLKSIPGAESVNGRFSPSHSSRGVSIPYRACISGKPDFDQAPEPTQNYFDDPEFNR